MAKRYGFSANLKMREKTCDAIKREVTEVMRMSELLSEDKTTGKAQEV